MQSCFDHILDSNMDCTCQSIVKFDGYWRPVLERVSNTKGDMTDISNTQKGLRQQIVRAKPIKLSPEGGPDKSLLWQPISFRSHE
jgi:hypothetical protein